MTNRLQAAVETHWPFPAEAWATAGGGTEALLLAISAAAPRGSTVAVDEPVVPGFLDTLNDLGITAVGVSADTHGPTPASLRAPSPIIRSHLSSNPGHRSLSTTRSRWPAWRNSPR